MKALSDTQSDLQLKLKRIYDFLEEHHFDSLLLQRKDNFAWLTSGGFNGIPYNSITGECGLLITKEHVFLLADTIEKPRITAEEMTGLSYEVIDYPWYQSIEEAVAKGPAIHRLASDTGLNVLDHQVVNIAPLRFSLTTPEVERIRSLGFKAASITEKFCQGLKPGMTEMEIAGKLNSQFMAAGLTPTVALVAADERIAQFRHPVPTMKPFYQKCMVISCVQEKGLTVALTRIVHVGKVEQSLQSIHEKAAWIDAQMISNTKRGVRAEQLLHTLREAYSEAGYKDEWLLHHQGGSIGYENRDFLLTPASSFEVEQFQAFAWNPSITGTKSEDTILVDGSRSEVITTSDSLWPMLQFESETGEIVKRPAIYEL